MNKDIKINQKNKSLSLFVQHNFAPNKQSNVAMAAFALPEKPFS